VAWGVSGKISCSTCGEWFIGEPPDWLCHKCWIIVGKKKMGEIMSNCDRCGKESRTSTGSYFNTDQICLGCWKKEKAHPDYERARTVEGDALLRGDFNFPGVGLPPELKGEKARR